MRFRRNQSLLLFILLGLLCATTLLAEQFTCDTCDVEGTIDCRGTESCNGYDVQDCTGCEFVCGKWIEGELYYGPVHDGCTEVEPI